MPKDDNDSEPEPEQETKQGTRIPVPKRGTFFHNLRTVAEGTDEEDSDTAGRPAEE